MAMLWQQRGAGSVIMALWYGLASDGGDIVCMYVHMYSRRVLFSYHFHK